MNARDKMHKHAQARGWQRCGCHLDLKQIERSIRRGRGAHMVHKGDRDRVVYDVEYRHSNPNTGDVSDMTIRVVYSPSQRAVATVLERRPRSYAGTVAAQQREA